ncbi:MAG: hypothetical protein ACOZQL_06710 [Myxococcota bacterium]
MTDPARAAASPELAVLSAMAYGKGERAVEVGWAAAQAALSLDGDRGLVYVDLVFAALSEAARRAMEELMSLDKYEYQSELARKYYGQGLMAGRAEGRAEGKAGAIVAVLRSRGLAVSAEVEERVLACQDVDVLAPWLERAVSVSSADAIFD